MGPKLVKALTISGVIVGGLGIGFGGGFLIGHFAKPKVPDFNIDVNAMEDNNDGLLDRYNEVKEAGKDPLSEFTISELANISLQKFSQSTMSRSYGYGVAKSTVNLTIRNATIRNNDEYLEESLSKSDPGSIMNIVVAQRDYQHGTNDDSNIDSYKGNISSDVANPDWNNAEHITYTVASYEEEFGKTVSRPSVYIISSKTVLEASTVNKTNDGYSIYMDLHTSNSVARYVKRMMNLSNSEVQSFDYIHLTFFVDSDFNLKKSTVVESYRAGMGGINAPVTNEISTYYFTGTSATMPEANENIDYPREGQEYA